MSKRRPKVWIVSFPDGKICDAELSRVSADHILACARATWLIPELFGQMDLSEVLDEIGRTYDLPLLIEAATNHYPTDAELRRLRTVADVAAFVRIEA